ncbi:MAG: MucR family transcriptional regulator [Alphaproteobacteria bacterium]|nr:MucR family transcriptional regulator [Alphaproteobacteria bacterium]
MADSATRNEALKLAVDLVGSYVQHNTTPMEQLNPLLQQMYMSILNLAEGNTHTLRTANLKPAVPIEESVQDGYIVCLEDGKKLQMLKRHIKTVYNMTVDQYKERWNLPPEYPVVSPDYAKRRSQIAKTSGLGQTGRRRRLSVITGANESAIVATK